MFSEGLIGAMTAGCTEVYCVEEAEAEFMPKDVLERAVQQAFAGEPGGTRVTTILLLSSHDYILRRVKSFLGHDPDSSQGTMGKPVTQPYYVHTGPHRQSDAHLGDAAPDALRRAV